MSAGTKVPMMLPAVERAKTRPATRPASATPVAARRMANGVTIPSSTTGGANSASDAANEPTTAPVEMVSMPLIERSRNGRATKGIAATHAAAASTMTASSCGEGRRSASASAEPVADRERREDEPDDVGPDDGRRAVVRGEQARGADLRRHGADAGEEDEDEQGSVSGGRHGGSLPQGARGVHDLRHAAAAPDPLRPEAASDRPPAAPLGSTRL